MSAAPLQEAAEDLVAALLEPTFYPHRPRHVHHVQTHMSHVFVASPFAYKLKKPVRFSFADFSTARARLGYCLEEVRLNRRLCPSVYLGVLPVLRTSGGRIALGPPVGSDRAEARGDPGGDAGALDHLVWMRALPEEGMAPAALAAGRITAVAVEAFARRLAAFHAKAGPASEASSSAAPEALLARWQQVLDDAAPMAGSLLAAEDRELLADFGAAFVSRHESLLEARVAAGHVREGHGDLHVGNLCWLERELPAVRGAPAVEPGLVAFDCLEFSRPLRVNDVASEVAFLAMDLEARGRADLASAFVEAYVAASGDDDLCLLLPFYACHRAAIRGMVAGLKATGREIDAAERAEAQRSAREHFALAARFAWRAAGPAIVACTGLSGSGKTTVALALAAATGWSLTSSDEVRKRAAGLDPSAPAPTETRAALYRREARRATYEVLARAAAAAVERGEAVIVDATFIRANDRALVADAAARAGCPHVFLECVADDATVRARLAARAACAPEAGGEPRPAVSDADWTVREAQRGERDPLRADEPHLRIDTEGSREELRARAVRALWSWRRLQPTRGRRR